MGNKSIGIGSGVIVAGDNISDYTGSFILSTNEGQIGIGKGSSIGMSGISIGSYNMATTLHPLDTESTYPKSAASFGNSGLRA